MQIRTSYPNSESLLKRISNIYRSPYTFVKKHHTFRRMLNLILIAIQKKIRSSYVFGYPYFLVVEPTNICNLKCPLCPTGRGLKGREKGKMSLANFKKIIDELGTYAYSIRLENWGEPLLNEEIFDMIAYAKSKKIATSFNTNLNFFDEHSAAKLILSGLDHIKISLDGTSGESYAKYRVGGNFNKVVENIRLLLKKRESLNKKNPFTEVQFIVMKHNEGEIDLMKKFCSDLGVDSLFIEKVHPDMREEFFNTDIQSIDSYKDWLPCENEYSIFDYDKKTRKSKTKFCSFLWTTTVVNWDGSVIPCCGIYDECYDFGNFFKDGFSRVWNGQRYKASRLLIGKRKKSDIHTFCLNCFKRQVIN